MAPQSTRAFEQERTLVMPPSRWSNLLLALVTATSFVLTGLYVTRWGTVATMIGAVGVLVFVFGVGELIDRRRRRRDSLI